MTDDPAPLHTTYLEYSAEYLVEGNWCCGSYAGDDVSAALQECRDRWKAGALGVRLVRRATQVLQERVR